MDWYRPGATRAQYSTASRRGQGRPETMPTIASSSFRRQASSQRSVGKRSARPVDDWTQDRHRDQAEKEKRRRMLMSMDDWTGAKAMKPVAMSFVETTSNASAWGWSENYYTTEPRPPIDGGANKPQQSASFSVQTYSPSGYSSLHIQTREPRQSNSSRSTLGRRQNGQASQPIKGSLSGQEQQRFEEEGFAILSPAEGPSLRTRLLNGSSTNGSSSAPRDSSPDILWEEQPYCPPVCTREVVRPSASHEPTPSDTPDDRSQSEGCSVVEPWHEDGSGTEDDDDDESVSQPPDASSQECASVASSEDSGSGDGIVDEHMAAAVQTASPTPNLDASDDSESASQSDDESEYETEVAHVEQSPSSQEHPDSSQLCEAVDEVQLVRTGTPPAVDEQRPQEIGQDCNHQERRAARHQVKEHGVEKDLLGTPSVEKRPAEKRPAERRLVEKQTIELFPAKQRTVEQYPVKQHLPEKHPIEIFPAKKRPVERYRDAKAPTKKRPVEQHLVEQQPVCQQPANQRLAAERLADNHDVESQTVKTQQPKRQPHRPNPRRDPPATVARPPPTVVHDTSNLSETQRVTIREIPDCRYSDDPIEDSEEELEILRRAAARGRGRGRGSRGGRGRGARGRGGGTGSHGGAARGQNGQRGRGKR